MSLTTSDAVDCRSRDRAVASRRHHRRDRAAGVHGDGAAHRAPPARRDRAHDPASSTSTRPALGELSMTRRFWPEHLAKRAGTRRAPRRHRPADLTDMMNALMITAVEGWVHGAHDALGPELAYRMRVLFAGVRAEHAQLSRRRRRASPRARSSPRHPRTDRHRPAAAPGSVRRTTSVDMLRPHGVDAELVLVGPRPRPAHRRRRHDPGARHRGGRGDDRLRRRAARHRDLLDPGDRRVSTARRALGVDRLPRRDQRRRSRDGPGDVVGRPVYQLLDDLPVATLISGYAPQHAPARVGHVGRRAAARSRCRRPRRPDLAMLPAGRPVRGLEGRRHDHAGLRRGQPAGRAPAPRAVARRRRRSAGLARAPRPAPRPRDAPSPPHRRASLAGRRPRWAARRRRPVPRLLRRRRGRDRRARVHRARRRRRRPPRRRAGGRRPRPASLPWFECPEAAASAGRLAGRTPRRPPRRGAGRVPRGQHLHPPQRHAPGPGRRRRPRSPVWRRVVTPPIACHNRTQPNFRPPSPTHCPGGPPCRHASSTIRSSTPTTTCTRPPTRSPSTSRTRTRKSSSTSTSRVAPRSR